jgi:hypothetical protein
VSLVAGDRKRLDEAYRAVMEVLGEKRGRPTGEKTVQAKLLLPVEVYSALKKAAQASNVSMSRMAAETLRSHLPPRPA